MWTGITPYQLNNTPLYKGYLAVPKGFGMSTPPRRIFCDCSKLASSASFHNSTTFSYLPVAKANAVGVN